MGFFIFDWIKRLLGVGEPADLFVEVDFRSRTKPKSDLDKPPLEVMELSRRLARSIMDIRMTTVSYEEFTIPKRNGDRRTIMTPCAKLKEMQERILHRLLYRLRVHPAATGFEPGRSIVTNALPHVGAKVVVRMDIRDFFPSTLAFRVGAYFRGIGWDEESVELLVKLTTWQDGLPQGAPTSPRLSNLLNYMMDARLDGLAKYLGGAYTRYADDITFSFPTNDLGVEKVAILATADIVDDYGYRIHRRRKLSIRRSHQQQLVTGLVVNEKPALPRKMRRKLRAIRHHIETGRPATMTPEQLAGWTALQQMIATQRAGTDRPEVPAD
jgi:retron-type reverse transcriptase